MVRNVKTAESAKATAPTATASGITEEAGHAGRPAISGPEATSIDGVRISCLTNIRYHSAREAFLDGTHRWLMFGIIVLGTGSFLDLLPGTGAWNWKAIFAAFTAVLAALDLVFDLSNRARQHSMMKRRYTDLFAEVTGGMPSEYAVAQINRFNGDEEPVFQGVLLAAWNAAQETVYGDTAMRYIMPWWVGWSKNFFRYEGRAFPVYDPRKPQIGPDMVSA